MTTNDYLYGEETNRRRELAYGILREPPAPFFSHQGLVFRVARLLQDHVEPRGLGCVGLAPIDVVLDAERALILQPDVLLVATERLSIIRDQVWGAPDQYGVREYWIVDLAGECVTVADFSAGAPEPQVFDRLDTVRSTLLPELGVAVHDIFH